MTSFLIQSINGSVKHDFAFHLLEAIEHQNWFYNNQTMYDFVISEKIEDSHKQMIPVGTLSFVFDYMKKHHNIDRHTNKPINIPNALFQHRFLLREVCIAQPHEMNFPSKRFVKSNNVYKSFTDITNRFKDLPLDDYLVSEVIEIDSEWRAFVHQGEMIGLKHYSGNFRNFPDLSSIDSMIKEYANCPLAYTLDVGINLKGTFLIEIHPFVSCGLYGFQNPQRLPLMFIQGFNHMVKEAKKKAPNKEC